MPRQQDRGHGTWQLEELLRAFEGVHATLPTECADGMSAQQVDRLYFLMQALVSGASKTFCTSSWRSSALSLRARGATLDEYSTTQQIECLRAPSATPWGAGPATAPKGSILCVIRSCLLL